jgi:hypothetical protein
MVHTAKRQILPEHLSKKDDFQKLEWLRKCKFRRMIRNTLSKTRTCKRGKFYGHDPHFLQFSFCMWDTKFVFKPQHLNCFFPSLRKKCSSHASLLCTKNRLMSGILDNLDGVHPMFGPTFFLGSLFLDKVSPKDVCRLHSLSKVWTSQRSQVS